MNDSIIERFKKYYDLDVKLEKLQNENVRLIRELAKNPEVKKYKELVSKGYNEEDSISRMNKTKRIGKIADIISKEIRPNDNSMMYVYIASYSINIASHSIIDSRNANVEKYTSSNVDYRTYKNLESQKISNVPIDEEEQFISNNTILYPRPEFKVGKNFEEIQIEYYKKALKDGVEKANIYMKQKYRINPYV